MEEPTDLTDAETKFLASQLAGSVPLTQDQKGLHAFLSNIATANDTTKLGFLTEEELGLPKLPERTLKELAVFCREVASEPEMASYFDKRAEILTSTSLSKEGFLDKLAVIIKREQTNLMRVPKKKKGWFGGKEQSVVEV